VVEKVDVGTALLGKEKGYEVFVSDKGTIKQTIKTFFYIMRLNGKKNHTDSKILNADL
jgi:UDP-N-acetylmuramoylalanine--D-glutamate ligase